MQFEGFIEIKPGYWYCEKTLKPYSNRGKNKNILKPLKQTKNGYYQVSVLGKTIKWHRLLYQNLKGPIPEGMQVDHKDNNPLNNDPDNLQLLNNQQNNCKKRKINSNTSGYPGVYWSKNNKNWVCRLSICQKLKHLGCFDDPLDAFICYLENKLYYHGWDSILPLI